MPEPKPWIFKAQKSILPGNVNKFDIQAGMALPLFRSGCGPSDKEITDSDVMINGVQ